MALQIVEHVLPVEPDVDRRFGGLVGNRSRLGGRGTEADGVHVDKKGTLDAPPAVLPHAAPVLIRVAHQGIGRQGGDGLVEVLYLHRRERYFNHVSVGAILAHRNPVAGAQHVVGRKLNAGHQSENAVLEDQHHHRRRSTESGQDGRGVLVDENADHDDNSHQNGDELNHLINAFERAVAQLLMIARKLVERGEEGADQPQRGNDQVDEAGLLQDEQQRRRGGESHRQKQIPDDGRKQPTEGNEQPAIEEGLIPFGLRLGRQPMDKRNEQQAEQAREEQRKHQDEQQQAEAHHPTVVSRVDAYRQVKLPEEFFDILLHGGENERKKKICPESGDTSGANQ